MDSVFLVWDNSRAEHGESPSLVNIYGNRKSAEDHVRREAESVGTEGENDYLEFSEFSVEERMVIG